MTSRPLLMKGPLVRRTLAGEKTETRRLVTSLTGIGKINNIWMSASGFWRFDDSEGNHQEASYGRLIARCPYGQPGDELWIRETWAPGDRLVQLHESTPPEYVAYRADNSLRRVTADAPPSADMRDDATPPVGAWRPAIFMPKDACRLRVRIVATDIEPLQNITAMGVRREGVATLLPEEMIEMGASFRVLSNWLGLATGMHAALERLPLISRFATDWDMINGARPGARWADNPYVWLIRYEVAR